MPQTLLFVSIYSVDCTTRTLWIIPTGLLFRYLHRWFSCSLGWSFTPRSLDRFMHYSTKFFGRCKDQMCHMHDTNYCPGCRISLAAGAAISSQSELIRGLSSPRHARACCMCRTWGGPAHGARWSRTAHSARQRPRFG